MNSEEKTEGRDASADAQLNRKRVDERASVNLACEIRIGSSQWHQAKLRDLTAEGFRVSLRENPKVGSVLRIKAAGLAMLEAQVCWAHDFEAGCKFAAPLSPYVFDHILEQISSN